MGVMHRVPLLMMSLCLVGALCGCADHPAMPQPSGPLRTMNPGLWNYHGNDVVPQMQAQSLKP